MGWFDIHNNDMDTTDDGKDPFVFRDDEDEESAEPIQHQQGLLNSDEDEEDEVEPVDPNSTDRNQQQQQQETTNADGWINTTKEDLHDDNAAMERAPASHHKPLLTFRRFWSELWCCQSWFHLSERVNQRELDIPESFAPFSCLAFLWKCVFAGACVGTLTYSFLDANRPEYVLAFLTHWASLANTLYSIMSVLNTIFAARTPQPHAETVGFRIRLTWVLFELAIHLGASATLLFWVFLFDADDHLEYLPLATHGGLFLLVLFDGFYVNRIPLRWMHYFGIIMPIEALYGVWTYIHYVTDIGNPKLTDSSNGNDDALYPGVIQWDDGWVEPLVYILVIVLAVGPALFCILWCVANGLCACHDTRRYFDDPIIDEDGRPTVDDVQEGSIFSLWK